MPTPQLRTTRRPTMPFLLIITLKLPVSILLVLNPQQTMGKFEVLNNGTLSIQNANIKDRGQYVCLAENHYGSDKLIVTLSVVAYPSRILEPKLREIKSHTGHTVEMKCKAEGRPMPVISWILANQTQVRGVNTERGRVSVSAEGTLVIENVTIFDRGHYKCIASNAAGADTATVRLQVVAAPPGITEDKREQLKAHTNQNLWLPCTGHGSPQMFVHENGTLHIKNLTPEHSGKYECIATSSTGSERRVVTLKVEVHQAPPQIVEKSKRMTDLSFGDQLTLNCSATGEPKPRIMWRLPSKAVVDQWHSRINVHRNGTLEIHNVRPTDTGEFICLARNDGGEAVMVVQLEVSRMLQRPIFKNPFNERVVSRFGKNVILNCSADGNPLPEIMWILPNGTRLTGRPNTGSHHQEHSDGTLTIFNPRKEDAGKYRCGAKNSLGYIEKLIILEIGQKPYILTRPRGIIRSVSGEPLYLHCLSDGSPRPRIYWTIPGGHTLTRPQVLGRYHLLENGTLVVHDTTLHDRGNYVCRARNEAGEAGLTVPVLIIGYPPRITTGPPPSLRAVTGTPIRLSCVATGIPKPQITWELPNDSVLSTTVQGDQTAGELLHPQGTLIIQKPTASDSGTYKCLAKNHLGTDSKITYVLVL
uniref:Ig-like domain-containing protein n=1 Tax=Salarias fasciatus TaxID=181472 RepID=A0A672FXE1_SALFA